jgi:hypothetical protein
MFERPPNCPVYIEYIITRALQSFYTFVYFTRGLSDMAMRILSYCSLRPTASLRPSAPDRHSTWITDGWSWAGPSTWPHKTSAVNVAHVTLSEIRIHGGWFMSQYVWRTSHVMVSKLSLMRGLQPIPPLILVMLYTHDGTEGAFTMRGLRLASPTVTPHRRGS